jgi:hypothetical protein
MTLIDVHTVKVGDEVPMFSRVGTLHAWNRYAAVNDEFVDIHMDDESGKAAGYPAAFSMGNLQFAYLHDMLREWIGDDGRIVGVNVQFRGAFVRHTIIVARGRVTDVRVEGGETVVGLEAWTEDGDGKRMAVGTAMVAVPSR